jgi:hypothetical protein
VPFDNEKQALEFVSEQRRAAEASRNALAMRNTIDALYYSGAQWASANRMTWGTDTTTLARRYTNWDPDTRKGLRVTINRVTQHVIKSANATYPSKIELDAQPDGRNTGPAASVMADTHESLVNAAIEESSYINAARDANFMRAIYGTFGVGLAVESKIRQVDGKPMPDRVVKAFCFEPHKLILDPGCQERALENHDTVIFCDIWTERKIRRLYPDLEFDSDHLQTIGQLTPVETELHRASGGMLFSQLKTYSRTKGARVYQVHEKDGTGRFSFYAVLIELGDTGEGECEMRWVNRDSPETPFGGHGLPLTILHGHRRPDSMWSMGETAMLKDDQDRLNLLGTLYFRQVHKNAGFQWLFPEEALRGGKEEDVRQQLTNQVAGVIHYRAGRFNEKVPPPQLVTYPSPDPSVRDTMEMFESKFKDQVHRSDLHYGRTKSHVPDSTSRRALEESDEVMGIRAEEDSERHESLLRVLHGTTVKNVKDGLPGALAFLTQRGFEADDFTRILQSDHINTPVKFRVRRSSVRYRSVMEKRAVLDDAMAAGHIDIDTYRGILASPEFDVPLSDNDRFHQRRAMEHALNVAKGQEWVPRSLGPYNHMQIEAFIAQMQEKWVSRDEEALQRLQAAVDMQLEMNAMDALKSSPEYLMAQQQAEQQPPADATQQETVALGDLLDNLVGPAQGAPQPGV